MDEPVASRAGMTRLSLTTLSTFFSPSFAASVAVLRARGVEEKGRRAAWTEGRRPAERTAARGITLAVAVVLVKNDMVRDVVIMVV